MWPAERHALAGHDSCLHTEPCQGPRQPACSVPACAVGSSQGRPDSIGLLSGIAVISGPRSDAIALILRTKPSHLLLRVQGTLTGTAHCTRPTGVLGFHDMHRFPSAAGPDPVVLKSSLACRDSLCLCRALPIPEPKRAAGREFPAGCSIQNARPFWQASHWNTMAPGYNIPFHREPERFTRLSKGMSTSISGATAACCHDLEQRGGMEERAGVLHPDLLHWMVSRVCPGIRRYAVKTPIVCHAPISIHPCYTVPSPAQFRLRCRHREQIVLIPACRCTPGGKGTVPVCNRCFLTPMPRPPQCNFALAGPAT